MNKYEGLVGKVLDGRYKILELAGMGGMACVLKAQDLVMNRIVAIKILNDEYNGNEQAEARFIDESKAVAMLSNKNIVSVYDVAIYPDIKYIVMEYLDGITLREYLDNKGAIDWKEACIYTLQILRALEHAHSKGIIHRDIKPQNVILMKNGDIKVTDFGIAKLPNSMLEQKDEKAIGTVYYISPEQACGQDTDYYSDIYSVGIMLYEAVTGTLPFVAETPMDVAMMQVNDEPVHPRDIVLNIPVGVAQIILKAMEKSPSDRFQSAHTMAKALEWVLRNPDVIFAMDTAVLDESDPIGKSSVISIDMIDTAELEPYNEEEMASSLGKKKSKAKEKNTPAKTVKGKKPAKKKKVSRSMSPIISGVTLSFLLVAVVIALMLFVDLINSKNEQDDEEKRRLVQYPNIVGSTFNEDLLVTKGYLVEGKIFMVDEEDIVWVSNDDVENNTIIATDPQPYDTGKPNDNDIYYFDSITVNVSSIVEVPELTGLSKKNAEVTLESLGLVVNFEEVMFPENPYVYDNQVISVEYQNSNGEMVNAEGVTLKVGQTVVLKYCTKSKTNYTAALPNLIGMDKDLAKRYAQYAKFTVEIVEQQMPDGDNTVFDQSITAGTVADAGTIVTLYVKAPYVGALMPNLIGYSLENAKTALSIAAGRVINVNYFYYSADSSMKTNIDFICANSVSLSDCLGKLEQHNCTSMPIGADPGTDFIVYQSLSEGSILTPYIYNVNVIIIKYTDSTQGGINPDVPGDTSDPTLPDTSETPDTSDTEVLP